MPFLLHRMQFKRWSIEWKLSSSAVCNHAWPWAKNWVSGNYFGKLVGDRYHCLSFFTLQNWFIMHSKSRTIFNIHTSCRGPRQCTANIYDGIQYMLYLQCASNLKHILYARHYNPQPAAFILFTLFSVRFIVKSN